ncbi:MAG: DUF1266 domain-containing protein [Kofleriaceae bacterium]
MSDYPLRVRWSLAIAAPVIAARGCDPRELGGWDREGIARARGEEEISAHTEAWLKQLGATDRPSLMAWASERVHASRELAQVVAAMGWAAWVGWLSDEDALQAILLCGALAQRAYPSWDEFAFANDLAVSDAVRALWAELPWQTPLDLTILAPPANRRILRGTCGHCAAPRTRPSPSAYVYCDHCGELADYDFVTACSSPLAPGPVYEALRAEVAPALASAHAAGDRTAYREHQLRLIGGWADACPRVLPVRAKDPEYRARYLAWLAEAAVVIAFDEEARRREARMTEACQALVFVEVDGRPRVGAEPFRAVAAAMFEFEARCDELCTPAVYAMHPDGAARELQRRIGYSQFAQGWLPFLDEAEAIALLERTQLAGAYDVVDDVATRSWPCASCGGPLDLVAGANRVVCEHCGRLVTVT